MYIYIYIYIFAGHSSSAERNFENRFRAKMKHLRQSRADYGLGVQVKIPNSLQSVAFSLGSGCVEEQTLWNYLTQSVVKVIVQKSIPTKSVNLFFI